MEEASLNLAHILHGISPTATGSIKPNVPNKLFKFMEGDEEDTLTLLVQCKLKL